VVVAELDIGSVGRLPGLLRTAAGESRRVIAAGGDGTVGSVAGYLVGSENVLGILPVGTGNAFARSLGLPTNPRRAAELQTTGAISPVDLGRFTRSDEAPAYFVHAATVGMNVNFAKLATQASVCARLGRLAYLAAAVYALRRTTFTCTLRHDGLAEELTLSQLSVISAPVTGGSLGATPRGRRSEDHRLDVIAVEDTPPHKLVSAGISLLLGSKRRVAGLHLMHLDNLIVDSRDALTLTLDGEPDGTLPGQFDTLVAALRVITPHRRRSGCSRKP
jgi:diacylglycerol kinase family enzyme